MSRSQLRRNGPGARLQAPAFSCPTLCGVSWRRARCASLPVRAKLPSKVFKLVDPDGWTEEAFAVSSQDSLDLMLEVCDFHGLKQASDPYAPWTSEYDDIVSGQRYVPLLPPRYKWEEELQREKDGVFSACDLELGLALQRLYAQHCYSLTLKPDLRQGVEAWGVRAVLVGPKAVLIGFRANKLTVSELEYTHSMVLAMEFEKDLAFMLGAPLFVAQAALFVAPEEADSVLQLAEELNIKLLIYDGSTFDFWGTNPPRKLDIRYRLSTVHGTGDHFLAPGSNHHPPVQCLLLLTLSTVISYLLCGQHFNWCTS